MQLWDRRNSETRKAYTAFLTFRNLGPLRTLKDAAKAFYGDKFTQGKINQCQVWSRINDWHERASAWDFHMLERRAMQREEDARAMNDRHAELAEKGQKVASIFVDHFLENEERIKAMSPRDALAFFEITAKVERIARGEPTENIQLSDSAESVLDRMRDNPEAQRLHSELVDTLSSNARRRPGNGTWNKGYLPAEKGGKRVKKEDA